MDYTLGDNVESLTAVPANLAGIGLWLANSDQWQTPGNNLLDGGAGNDIPLAVLAMTPAGGDGNDRLDGGVGCRCPGGWAGNDLYVIDDLGDVIVEDANGGIDSVPPALITPWVIPWRR